MDLDDDIFKMLFAGGEGAVPLLWEQASRCTCWTEDTHQPTWGHTACGGTGVVYATGQAVTGLFRAQSRWLSFRREGELAHGQATLTTPLDVRPGYTDRRVRDRLTVTVAVGDMAAGTAFFPASKATPFVFAGVQRAWRVSLQLADLDQQLT